MYKTIVVKYSPKAKEMAARIEDVANQMEQEGFELVSCSITPSSRRGFWIFRQIKAPQPTEVCEQERIKSNPPISAAYL